MQEAETRLVRNTFSKIMPYLVYPQDLRNLLESYLSEATNIEELVERLRKKISAEIDPARKTDGQIFINELRKSPKSLTSL